MVGVIFNLTQWGFQNKLGKCPPLFDFMMLRRLHVEISWLYSCATWPSPIVLVVRCLKQLIWAKVLGSPDFRFFGWLGFVTLIF